MPSRLDSIVTDHNRWIDSIVSAFEEHMGVIVARASAKVQAQLARRLTLASDDTIERTPANLRVLRSIDKLFLDAMEAEGFGSLVDAYVGQFPGQMQFFCETLDAISANLKTPLPKVKFSQGDISVFASQQVSATDAITAAVEIAATGAKRQAMFSVAGLAFKDLVATLAEQFQASIGKAKSLADTATSIFYRTISERGFEIIEQGTPEGTIRYTYLGPLDAITRPFCRHLEEQARKGRTWTRAEIDAMDNGQLPNTFLTAGGHRCRHQWSLAALSMAQAA